MMHETPQCSESYCNLHDYQINYPGICLRQDALRRSARMSSEVSEIRQELTQIKDVFRSGLRQQTVPVPRPAPKPQSKPKDSPSYRWKH